MTFPSGELPAQRIKIPMIAGGNHISANGGTASAVTDEVLSHLRQLPAVCAGGFL